MVISLFEQRCRTACVVALVVAFGALGVGCAGSPAQISKMSPEDLTKVTDAQLCYTYAALKGRRASEPNVDAEVARRNADCALEVEYHVDDCSALDIVSAARSTTYVNLTEVTVKNSSPRPKRFRLMAPSGVYGETQIVGPESTVTIKFVEDRETAQVSGALQILKGEVGSNWQVFQCFTARSDGT